MVALATAAMVIVAALAIRRRRGRRRSVGPDSYTGVEDFRRAMDAIAPDQYTERDDD